jgi:hypothetical protein
VYRLIIDADPIVYRAGFAAEEHHYRVVIYGPDGEFHEYIFKPCETAKGKRVTAGAQMKAFFADPKRGGHGDVELELKEKVVVPEPLEHALHIVNQEIEGIVAAARERYKVEVDDLDIHVILSGPGNFREKIATLAPYKGNREVNAKPHWYQQIRDHLTQRWNARVVEGREADDEVSILGWTRWRDGSRLNYLIATIDKDLDQVPGMHYDYRQKVFYNVSRTEAEQAFWRQVISGDATDNIPGCYKVGTVKAANAVAGLIAELGREPTEAEYWALVLRTYEHSQGIAGCPYADKPARDVALETARLVYMQRRQLELWVPPGEPLQWLEATIDD